MARKNATIETVISDDANMITFTVAGFDPIVVDITKLDPDLIAYAAAHGLKQKIGDTAALGKGSPDSDKYAAMRAMADRLISGDWAKPKGETSGAVAGIIYRAFAQWAGEMAVESKSPVPDAATLRAAYDGMDTKAQRGLRNVPRIAAIMDELRAAKSPAKSVDAGALLAGLGIGAKPSDTK
jgi:hypothetical protein